MELDNLLEAFDSLLQQRVLQQNFGSATSDKDVQRLPFGEYEGGGALPEGYDPSGPSQSVMLTRDPLHTAAASPDEALLITTIPIMNTDDKLKDHPDNWAECLMTAYVKRMIYQTKGFPRPLNRNAAPTYKISPVAGKGVGMVAARRIGVGEMICDERPLLVVPTIMTPLTTPDLSFMKTATREQIVQAKLAEFEKTMIMMVERMPQENQDAYKALHNCHKHDGSGPLTGIMRTNGFGLADHIRDKDTVPGGKVGMYLGAWNDLSRMNHSCSPNTDRNWSTSSFSMKLRAARAIEKGEEITCDYLGELLNTTEQRQQSLAPYGFSCSCKACLNQGVTDARRKKYLTWQLGKRLSKSRRGADLEYAVHLLREMTEDGLQVSPCYHSLLLEITRGYMALGDEENALRFGQRLHAVKVATGKGKAFKQYTSVEAMKKNEYWKSK